LGAKTLFMKTILKTNYLYAVKSQKAVTAIIIDDDPFCSFQLQDMITKYCHEIDILAVCDNGIEGLAKIQALTPEVVFLDVEMPGMNGFEMLRNLHAINFEIIFTTLYPHYAIRAIRFSALDYLLKPIDGTALQEAVSRLTDKRQHATKLPQPLQIVGYANEKKLNNLAVPTMEGLLFIGLQEIIYCESDDKYTKIFLSDKKMVLSSRTMGDFEELLQHHGFFRIHKSYLINLGHLKKYLRGEGGQVIMANGATLDVSRRKKNELLDLVSQF